LGQFDGRSGDALEAVHKKVSINQAPVKRMSLENAELAKIAVNSFVTMKISFANMLAEFCEKIPEGNVDVVSDALGMDKRIGRKYLTGGLGFGGPCFPRDNVALDFMGKTLGVDSALLRENDAYNRRLAARLVEKIRPHIPAGASVGVLGLAYKPHSHVVEESPGVAICQALADQGYRVLGHDPLAVESARGILQYRAVLCPDLNEVLEQSEVLILTTTDPAYQKLVKEKGFPGEKVRLVVDPWRIMAGVYGGKTRVLSFGMGSEGVPETLRQLWS
jgi:UDPglucose 6-dehydrogenase